MVKKDKFGPYDRYTIATDTLEVSLVSLGASLASVKYKGNEHVLYYLTPEQLEEGKGCVGKALGRYANRIGGSAFDLNGTHYRLTPNEGVNQLHGGPNAFNCRVWQAEAEEDRVRFSIFSPDGDNGYPGNLTMTVTWSVKGSVLRVDFTGETDRPTVFSPSVHPYFTFGESCNVRATRLQVSATGHVEVGPDKIPTGRILPCEGKYDFSEMRVVTDEFDDCFVTPDEHLCTLELGECALEVVSDLPAVQVYTGIHLKPPFVPSQGLALEPEFFPDSPNHPDFPSTVLEPGKPLARYAEFRFTDL